MSRLDPFGPALKVTRAKRHIRDLTSLLESFLSDNPHRIEFRKEADNSYVVQAVFDRPLPNETSTIIGDVVHNLRAALDHVAVQSIKAINGTTTRNTGFPIYEKEVDFDRAIGTKLNGAPQQFINFVSSRVKPYKFATDGGVGNTLIWVLSRLDNLDKHIVLLPTISVLRAKNVRITNDQGLNIEIGEIIVSGEGRATNLISVGLPDVKYAADPNSEFSVRFTKTDLVDGEDVIALLTKFEQEVSGVIHGASLLDLD